jgi:hypothetical protein
MAKLYASSSGSLVRLVQTEQEEKSLGDFTDFAEMLDFDGNTNQGVIQNIMANWNIHSLSGGVLYRDGLPIQINPPGDEYLERQQATAIEQRVRELLRGLAHIENSTDFGYAYVARLLAKANGENDQTILNIVDRATAQAYVTGMSQWQNLTAAQRQWLAVDLESRAYDAMVIRLLLAD